MKKTDKQILFERMHKVTGMPLNEDIQSWLDKVAPTTPLSKINKKGLDEDIENGTSKTQKDEFSKIEPKEKRMVMRLINQKKYLVPESEFNDFIGMIIEFEDEEISIDDLKKALEVYKKHHAVGLPNHWSDKLFDTLSKYRHLLSKYNIADSMMQLYYDDVEYEMGDPDYRFNSGLYKDQVNVELKENVSTENINRIASNLLVANDGPLNKIGVISRAMEYLTKDVSNLELYANALDLALDELEKQGGMIDSNEFPNAGIY